MVRRPCGRRHQELRLPHRSVRSGKRTDDPSRRRRVCHHRRARRNPRPGCQGHHRTLQGLQGQGRRRPHQGASEPREARHRPLQISACHRVCGRAAQDHQRQDTPRRNPQERREAISRGLILHSLSRNLFS